LKSAKSLLVAAAAALSTLCAHAQTDPGLTDKTIKIGMFGPLSGNSMAYGFDVMNAAKMYYDKVNKEGGIHGRKIELVIEDDRCNANDLLAAVKKLTEQDKVFALNGGSCSAAVVGAREYVERSQIPLVMLNASGDGALYPPSKYIYGAFSISQRAVGGSMVQFATEYLKAKKIGYINHDDAYGGWNLEAAEFQAKKLGVDLQVQSVAPNLTDVTAPMLKIRAANPDVLLITTYARPVSLLVKKAQELGWTKPIVIAVNGTADLKQLVENVGNMEAFKNVYLQEVMADVAGGPKLKWVYDMYKAYYPELASKPGYPQTYMPYGIPSAMTVVNALKAAGPQPTREKFLTARMAVSGANFAVAETGTLVVVESEGNGRMCLTLPEVLVSVVGIEKVVPTWEDLDVFLRLLPRSSTGERMNPYTSTWTGVTPGDGPQEVVVVLLDNGRTRALADQVGRQALRCIRCSACLNSCPVYERVGGHAYGSVYPGPIGAILNPLLKGVGTDPQVDSLPYASSLCGACFEVCPVRIDIPSVLVDLRAQVVDAHRGGTPSIQTVAMKGAAATFRSGRRLGLAEQFARLGTGVAARFGASGWTGARDLPRAPRESFRAWWRRTDGGRS